MACAAFEKLDINKDVEGNQLPYDKIIEALDREGTRCILANGQRSCSNYCTETTKNYQGCFNCLGSGFKETLSDDPTEAKPTCTTTDENQNIRSCCPHVQIAVACSQCISKKGARNETTFVACRSEQDDNSSDKIWIIAGSVLGVVILIAVIAVVIRFQRNASAQSTFAETLGREGVDQRVVADIQNMNTGQIDASVLRAVEDKQAQRFADSNA